MKAFGDMGQTAHLRLIRDRFLAGHSSCELRRYLDSVSPETPIRDVVDRCRVWESHADPEIRRVSKPVPELTYPAYVVDESYNGVAEVRVATVNKPSSSSDQLEELLGRLLKGLTATAPVPPLVPQVPAVDKLLQRLAAEIQRRQSALAILDEHTGLEKLLRSCLSEQQPSRQQFRPRPARRGWNEMVYFACGKLGHGANRCPTLDDSFPFMLPGWRAESTLAGFLMISPRMAADRRWAENGV